MWVSGSEWESDEVPTRGEGAPAVPARIADLVVSNNSMGVLIRAIERACEMYPGLLAT